MKQNKITTPKLDLPLYLVGPILSDFAGIQPKKSVSGGVKRKVVSFVQNLKNQHGVPVKRTLQSIGIPRSRYYRWEKLVAPPEPDQTKPKTQTIAPEEEVVFKKAVQKYPHSDTSRFRFILSREFGLDLNPKQLKAMREKHGLTAKSETDLCLHKKARTYSGDYQGQPIWLRYLCFLRIDGVDADFPLCMFVDAHTQAVVHWELGMEWPRVLASGNTFDTYKKYQDHPNPPKIVGTNDHWHLANEFIRCVESQGFHHQQTWSYDHALHRRTGKQAGWMILSGARENLRKNISWFRDRFDSLVEDYNQFWPVASHRYQPPEAI